MKVLIQKIHYDLIKGHRFLKLILGFFSIFYFVAIGVKNFLYKIKILRPQKISGKVICVGNLTTGGVGKTPVVCEIANYLAKKGQKVAILSRGYGGKLNDAKVNLIKDFEKILIEDVRQTGDEPMLVAQNTKNCAVLTCKNRVKSAQYAIKYLGAQVLVMDDGFSNRKIYKDLMILAIDNERRFGNGYVLPLGPNREPISEIQRANKLLIVSKSPNIDVDWARIYQKPLHVCQFKPGGFYELKSLAPVTPKMQKVIAFCGIGQPESFYNYLTRYFEVTKTIDYKDHHHYTQKDIKTLVQIARENGVKTFVTTQKDAVKLKNLTDELNFDIFVLKLKPVLDIEAILNDRRSEQS